jgi:hypothetical protein
LAQVNALRRTVHAYDAAHPGQIHTIASGSECKIPLADRQPDGGAARLGLQRKSSADEK